MSKEILKNEFGDYQGLKEMNVSPAMAERWLNTNTHNRPLSERKMLTYELMMSQDKWVVSNDCILFFEDGSLGNGQHRLWALSNLKERCPDLTIPLTVKWGVAKKHKQVFVMDYLDRVSVRKSSQNWWLTHYSKFGTAARASKISAAINIISIIISRGIRPTLEAHEIDIIYQVYKNELENLIESSRTIGLTTAPIMAALVFAAKVEPEKTFDFATKLFSGENLEHGSPILTLRNKVVGNLPLAKTKLPLFKMVLSALRSFVDGNPLEKLYVTDVGFDYFASSQELIMKKIYDLIIFRKEEALTEIIVASRKNQK